MNRALSCMVLFLFACLFCACSVQDQNFPTEAELREHFQVQIPALWQVTSFKTDNPDFSGSSLHRSRFQAVIELKTPIYQMDSEMNNLYLNKRRNYGSKYSFFLAPDTRFVKLVSPAGEKHEIFGIVTVKKYRGEWDIDIRIENDPNRFSGKPLNFYQGGTVYVSGSSECEKFWDDLKKRAQEGEGILTKKKEALQKEKDDIQKKRDEGVRKQKEQIEAMQKEALKTQQEYMKALEKTSVEQMKEPFNELKIYKFGQEPDVESEKKNVVLFPTKNLTKSPFMLNVTLFDEKDYDYKTRSFHYSGSYSSEQGNRMIFLRVLFINPIAKKYKDLIVIVSHYIYDIPYSRTTGSVGTTIVDKSKIKLYKNRFYKLKYVKPNFKYVIDTQGIELYFEKSKFIDDSYDRSHPRLDDTRRSKTGHEYVGFIISILHKGKLLFQKTNNRVLNEKGQKTFSQELRNYR